jgi:hypothetical protein
MVNIISDYIPPFSPLPNIAPFTYKDGETYLSMFERIRSFVNTTIIEFVNDNVTGLGENFKTEVNNLIDVFNDNLTAQNADIADKVTELTEYVNTKVQQIISSSIEVNDPMVAEMINTTTTLARGALDALLANIVSEDANDPGTFLLYEPAPTEESSQVVPDPNDPGFFI